MRTAKVATALALGALLSFTFMAMPVAAGCSSLVADPSGCATAIYKSARGNVQATASGAGAWASFLPVYITACPSVPTVVVEVPGLPGNDAIVVYANDLQEGLEAFQAGAAVSLFPAMAVLVGSSSNATLDMLIHYNDQLDTLVIPLLSSGVPDGPEDVPFPMLPDLDDGADAWLSYASENAASLEHGVDETAACLQNLPPP